MNRRSFFKTILAGLGMVAVPSVFVAAAKPVLVEEKPREMILDWEGRDWYKSRKPMTATEVLRRQEEAAKELDHNLSELWHESIINLDDKVTWMLHTGRLVTVDKEAPQTVTIHPPWQLFRATNKME